MTLVRRALTMPLRYRVHVGSCDKLMEQTVLAALRLFGQCRVIEFSKCDTTDARLLLLPHKYCPPAPAGYLIHPAALFIRICQHHPAARHGKRAVLLPAARERPHLETNAEEEDEKSRWTRFFRTKQDIWHPRLVRPPPA